MRIGHIITGLATGGAERMLLKLLSATDRTRFEPLVISLMDQGTVGSEIEALNIPVLTLDLPRGQPRLSGVRRLHEIIRHYRPDVLQGWMYHGNLTASLAALFAPNHPPVVWNIRQSLDALAQERRLTRWLIHLSARLSAYPAAIIHNSLAGALQHERFGFSATRRVIIPNGFDPALFIPSATARHHNRKTLGLTEHDIVIGLAARYHPMKDHATCLRAAAILAEHCPSLRLLLAGTGVDRDNHTLTALIGELGLENRVMLLGELNNMAAFFQSLDLATLSSARAEGFPNVLGEAMASGVPCVATDVGDVSPLIGDTGLIVPPGNPARLAEAWRSLIESGADYRMQLGRLARERIKTHYTLPAIAQQYEDLYQHLIQPPR